MLVVSVENVVDVFVLASYEMVADVRVIVVDVVYERIVIIVLWKSGDVIVLVVVVVVVLKNL